MSRTGQSRTAVDNRRSQVRTPAGVVNRTAAHRAARRSGAIPGGAAVRLTERLLSEARDEVRRADAKAAQWLTVTGGGMLALLAALSGRSWSPAGSAGSTGWTWWAGWGCAGLSLLALVLALVPRTGGDADLRHVAYFGHIHRLRDPAVVRRCIEVAARDTMPGMIAELCWMSRLAMTKYRYTRIGTIMTALAVGLISISLL